MAIAKSLPDIGIGDNKIDPRFMQNCPFCQRPNRIVMHGLFVLGDKVQQHPDMGYSFCNCKNMFYTRPENLRCEPIIHEPIVDGILTAPDPFFAWPDPYQFLHWDVRRYQIIWPMDSLCEYLKEKGYAIVSAERDFDVHSKTPQHFHIKVTSGDL